MPLLTELGVIGDGTRDYKYAAPYGAFPCSNRALFGTWSLRFLWGLVLGIWSFSPALADTRTSADYEIRSDTLDSAGNAVNSTDYQLIGSLGTIGSSINSSSADATLWNGYIGQQLQLVPAIPLEILTAAALPVGRQTVAYSETITATGGFVPRTFTLTSGSLPSGLALSVSGVISGTPTTIGSSTFTVQVSDSEFNTITRTFTLDIHPFSFTWNSGSGDWANGANWTPTGVPGPDDYAIVNNGGSVTVSDTRSVGQFDLGNAVLQGGGSLTINRSMNWGVGYVYFFGPLIIGTGATLTMDCASPSVHRMTSSTLDNAGTVIWKNTGEVTLDTFSLFTNRPQAVFEIQTDSQISGFSGGACNLNNAGMVRKTAGIGTNSFQIPFKNYGAFEVQSGAIKCQSVLINSGMVTLSAGRTLTVVAGGSSSGVFNAPSGALVDFAGPYTFDGDAQLNGAGLYQASGPSEALVFNTFVAVENFNLLNDARLQGGGPLAVNTSMNWGAGYAYNFGRLIIGPGATLTMDCASPSVHRMTGSTLDNAGTVIWRNTGEVTLDTFSLFTNRPQAVFEIQTDSQISGFSGGACNLNNAGTVLKTAGIGTNSFQIPFKNYGTFEVQNGGVKCQSAFNNFGVATLSAGRTLTIVGGGSSSGVFNAPSGALVDFAGPYTFDGDAQLNGVGLYRASGPSEALVFNTFVAVENFNLLNDARLQGGGPLAVNTSMNWGAGYLFFFGPLIVGTGATLTMDCASPSVHRMTGSLLDNAGTVIWKNTGDLSLDTGSLITNRPGAFFIAENNASLSYGGAAAVKFDNAGTFLKTNSAGTTIVGSVFNNYGTNAISTGTLNLNSTFTQYGGLMSLCSGNVINGSALQILGGEVRGAGNISGDVNNVGGTVSPGCSPGQLTIGGNYTQGANGTLNVELAGTTPGSSYDRLAVTGTATLGGSVRVALSGGFEPAPNASFMFLTGGSVNGGFASFNYPSNDVGLQLIGNANSDRVQVINVRPTIPAIGTQTIDEMSAFNLPLGATDADTPTQTLSYSLQSSPGGATVNGSGVFNWTPNEQQGPMTTNITVRVTDNGTPNLSATNTFTVIVNEVNVAPVVGALSDHTINAGQTINFSATASDSDVPANMLSFSLVSPPAGATITSGGQFNWRPGVALGNTTNLVRVRVQDDGSPVLSHTNTFAVNVNSLASVVLTPVEYLNGQFRFNVSGDVGPDYVIQASTNFSDWVNLNTNLSPTLPFQFIDPAAGSRNQRAYRVRLEP